jgi:hypothetical protein
MIINHVDGVPATNVFEGRLSIKVYNATGTLVFNETLTPTASYILGFDVTAQGNQFILVYKPEFNVVRVRYYTFSNGTYQVTYDRQISIPGIDMYNSVSNEFENTVRIASTASHYFISTHVRVISANQSAYLIAKVANGLVSNSLNVTNTVSVAQGIIPINSDRIVFQSIAVDKGRDQIAFSYHYQVGIQQRIRCMLMETSNLSIIDANIFDSPQDFNLYKFSSDFSHNNFLIVYYHFGLQSRQIKFNPNSNLFTSIDITIRPS